MNRSLFQSSPFRSTYGLHPVRPRGLGQLDDLTEAVQPLLDEFDSFISKLPIEVAGPYAKRRDECMAKSTLSQYKCLYDLFQDVKRAYKDDGSPTAPAPVKPSTPPPSSGLPLLPIAAGAVGLAALLYFAFKGN
jgi:hypothetical protein